MRDVLAFINRFTVGNEGHRIDVVECFTHGCCYWFAYILRARFGGDILIDYVANHFGCLIGTDVYDITGEVTDSYRWERWEDCQDALLKARIERDCIYF